MTQPRKGYRLLTVGSYTYQYKVGKVFVCIYDPLGFKDTPKISEILGREIYPYEKVSVLPSDIERYVRKDFVVAKPA